VFVTVPRYNVEELIVTSRVIGGRDVPASRVAGLTQVTTSAEMPVPTEHVQPLPLAER
jgi:hypothetical protein